MENMGPREAHLLKEDLRRTDAARAVAIAGIYDVLEGIRHLRQLGVPDTRILEQVEKTLARAQAAHKRKWQS